MRPEHWTDFSGANSLRFSNILSKNKQPYLGNTYREKELDLLYTRAHTHVS